MEIAKIMLKDHLKLNSFLDETESYADLDLIKKTFSKFKWNLEKHFFVEEKVIFITLSENDEIINLVKQHKDILWLIKKIEESINKNEKPDISKLKQALDNHIVYENNIFYPLLDDTLDENQKQIILDRAEEILE